MLCGLSAGSLCWFSESLTAFHGAPKRVDGLGLLPYSNCVHYDAEPERREQFVRMMGEGMSPGYAAEDSCALHFEGQELARAISSRAGKRAFRVDADGEHELDVALPRGGDDGGVSRREPTILAMGGGGFTMEPDNPALDDFALSLTGVREPRVLFLPTASGDPAGQIQAFRQRFGGRAVPRRRPVAVPPPDSSRSLADIIGAQDLIYVGGGSMRNLLAIWRTHGLDACLHDAWRAGTVLAGLSAGAMCWFEGGVTKSFGAPDAGGRPRLAARLAHGPCRRRARAPAGLARGGPLRRPARRVGGRRRRRPGVPRDVAGAHRLLAAGDDGAAGRLRRRGAGAAAVDARVAGRHRLARGVRRRAGAPGRPAPPPLGLELRH